MTEWACVGCQPPHWECGIYIEHLAVHPDCRRHNPDVGIEVSGYRVYFDDVPGRNCWALQFPHPSPFSDDLGGGISGMDTHGEACQALESAMRGERALRAFLGPAWAERGLIGTPAKER